MRALQCALFIRKSPHISHAFFCQNHSRLKHHRLARRRYRCPGIAIGIAKGGRIIWRGARGLANVEAAIPFTPSTPFRICSISKQFACALTMREVRGGRIALDAHPSRYLPWAKVLDSALTIAHLMQNKSGVRDQWVLAMMMGARAEQRFTLADGIEVNRLAPESMFAPGSQNLYCNANFEILGQILEAVTGETCAALLAKHIFAPLGMKDTYLGIDTAQPLVGDARGYRFHDGAWVEEENRSEEHTSELQSR